MGKEGAPTWFQVTKADRDLAGLPKIRAATLARIDPSSLAGARVEARLPMIPYGLSGLLFRLRLGCDRVLRLLL